MWTVVFPAARPALCLGPAGKPWSLSYVIPGSPGAKHGLQTIWRQLMTSRRFTLDTGTEVIRTVIRVTIMDEHLTHRFLISSPNKHSASKATQKKCQLYDKKKKKADIHLDIQASSWKSQMDNAVLPAKQDWLWSRMTRYCVFRDDASPQFCSDTVVWLEIGNRAELPGLLFTGCVTRGESLTSTRDHECQRRSIARQDALREWWDVRQSRGHGKAPWSWGIPRGLWLAPLPFLQAVLF